jgi:hypothetical protein
MKPAEARREDFVLVFLEPFRLRYLFQIALMATS